MSVTLLCTTYPEEASKEASRKHGCNAVVKCNELWILVVFIDYSSHRVQNITHGSEVDNTEDSYLLGVVKEAFHCVIIYTCMLLCLHVLHDRFLCNLQGYNRAHN